MEIGWKLESRMRKDHSLDPASIYLDPARRVPVHMARQRAALGELKERGGMDRWPLRILDIVAQVQGFYFLNGCFRR